VDKKHSLKKSFKYAFAGVKTSIVREPNLRIHVFFALIAITAASLLGFNPLEWIILFLTIFFVIMLELINTVLEALVDIVSPEFSPEAKTAKDVSAAAVLLAAFVSVIVGIILFLPKILTLF
jgi:undecaprenol kinase